MVNNEITTEEIERKLRETVRLIISDSLLTEVHETFTSSETNQSNVIN